MDSRAVCLLLRKQLFHRLRNPHPHGLAFQVAGLKHLICFQRRVRPSRRQAGLDRRRRNGSKLATNRRVRIGGKG